MNCELDDDDLYGLLDQFEQVSSNYLHQINEFSLIYSLS